MGRPLEDAPKGSLFRQRCRGVERIAGSLTDYDVTFLSDAIGAENLPAYEASIR